MAQMITQLGTIFDISYPDAYKGVLRVVSMINLDLVNISPFECLLPYSFYTSLVSHTILPLAAVAGLLAIRPALKKAGKQEASLRCVTAAFYVVFFVYPSVTAKIFTTFNCEQFDGEFDGSDSWMRVDLTIDCNAPERGGWIAYAGVMSTRAKSNRALAASPDALTATEPPT